MEGPLGSSAADRDPAGRVLLVAPGAEDARACCQVLAELSVSWHACAGPAELARETAAGAGAILLTDEALAAGAFAALEGTLARQPCWSDLPVVVLVPAGGAPEGPRDALDKLGNVLLVERSLSPATLRSAVRVAFRSRERQYQSRDRLLTQQHQEQALADRETFRAMFDLSAVGQAQADPATGRFLRVNHAFCELTGYSAGELLGMTFGDVTHPDDRAGDAEAVRRVADGRADSWSREKRYVRKDGRVQWVHVTGTLLRDASGRPLRNFAFILDITETRRVAEALERSRAEFQAMLDSLSEAVVVADPQRRIVLLNPAFTALFGYEPGEAMGRTTRFLYAEESDYEAQGRARYGADVEPPRDPYEMRYRRKDGSTFLAESVGTHFRDAQGRLIGFFSLHRDVTEREAARALLERRERDYRTLAENLPGLVYRVHLRERRSTQFFNDLVESMTGYTVGELTTGEVCSIDPLIVADDRRAVVDTVHRAVAEQLPFEVTYRIRSREGELRHLTERGRPIYGDDGQPLYVDGVIFDVTDHRRAEAALAEGEERFRQMAGNIAEVFFLVTPDWNQVLYISPAYEKVWGRSCQSLYESARSWLEAVVPEDVPTAIAAVEEGIAGDLPKVFPEYRILRPDGTERWIEARGWPVLDEHGHTYRVAGIATDITARKKAEEALRQGCDELQALLDSTSDGLLVADIETRRLVRANAAICRMLGYSAEELLSLSVPDIHPPETASLLLKKFDAFPEGGPEVLENAPVRARDGTVLRVDLSGRNIVYRGRPCGIGFFHDVTRRVEMEKELEEARAAAEAASEAKSRFLANTSHDLRTPMNAILGMIGLALDEGLSPTVRDDLETARDAATTLLGLLDDVLDLSRVEAGRLELESRPFLLLRTVEQVVKTLAPRACEKGLELFCEWPADVPEHVEGDPLRLRQILGNLLDNAVKFTPAGDVVVGLEVVSREKPEVVVRFSVADTGIGIAPEDQQRIFEPFLQSDASSTREHQGSGLGLAIAAGLVERMGGRIHVRSEPGRGATFDFTVPLKRRPAPPPEAAGPALPAERWRDVPVLIVSESATGRRVLEKTLAAWSLKPESVADEPTALARLREAAAAGHPFRLVLAEHRGAGAGGLALARALKEEPALAERVILMASAVERARSPLGCAEVGAVCLEKPVLPSSLRTTVAATLRLADGERPSDVGGSQACSRRAGRVLRVLVAEDSPAGQRFVDRLLSRRGHQVEVASDGERAVEMVRRQDFDVVLMDVQMPRMDGLRATVAIRALAEPARARLPVVALTAHALKGEAERCLAAGMDAYLSKPVDGRQLIELVERLGGVTSAPRSAALPPEETRTGEPAEGGSVGEQAGRDEASSGVFDPGEALRACYGSPEILQDMIEFFFEEAKPQVRALRRAVSAGNAQDLARLAHRLNTTVFFLGARPAVEAARAVEAIGTSGELAGAGEAVERLAGHLRALGQALSAQRRSPEGEAVARPDH
jgi:two-component system sensor histidine kinase/response regulator